MHANYRTRSRRLDLMRPSEIIGRTVPATDDPRRWLRAVLRALAALAAAVILTGLLGAAAR